MTNSPTNIFEARLHSVESIRDVLGHMDQQRRIELNDVYKLIDPDHRYYVIHNITHTSGSAHQNLVQGDSLSIFIQDYIEPGLGDGLDMHVFPEDGAWCMIFDIDGSIFHRF